MIKIEYRIFETHTQSKWLNSKSPTANTPFSLESKEGAQITFSAQLKQDCG